MKEKLVLLLGVLGLFSYVYYIQADAHKEITHLETRLHERIIESNTLRAELEKETEESDSLQIDLLQTKNQLKEKDFLLEAANQHIEQLNKN